VKRVEEVERIVEEVLELVEELLEVVEVLEASVNAPGRVPRALTSPVACTLEVEVVEAVCAAESSPQALAM